MTQKVIADVSAPAWGHDVARQVNAAFDNLNETAIVRHDGLLTIADDTAVEVPLPFEWTTDAMIVISNTESDTRGCIAQIGVENTWIDVLSQAAAVYETSTSDLGGTTGNDNVVTIGINGGTIKIENRIGASRDFHYTFLAGS